jgi:hypothetical protein
MTIDDGMKTAAEQHCKPLDGKKLYKTLQAKGHHVWRVGPKHYLWFDDKSVDIESWTKLNVVLHAHGFLQPGQRLEGPVLQEFQKICRNESISFDKSVEMDTDPKERQNYKNVKYSQGMRREYFSYWVKKYVQPYCKV